jgi:CHAT domain-containing protein
VRGPGPLGPVDHRAVMDRARQEIELAERTLAARSASYRGELGRSQIGLAQVAAALPAEGALISFVRYQRVRFDGPPADGRPVLRRASAHPAASYLAFVLRRDHPVAAIRLGPAPQIDARIHRWREDVIAEALNGPMPPGSGQRSSRGSGAAVRRSTWDPVVRSLGGVTRVFIVPDGALSLVPFAALPTGTTRSLLEDGPTLHFLNAERDLVPDTREPSGAATGLLALGGPAYDDAALFAAAGQRRPAAGELAENGAAPQRIRESDCGELRTIRFPMLAGTVQEVRDVGSLWIGGDGPGGGARVLVGSAASERAFKQEAPRRRVLHLATHGFFLGGQPCRPSAQGTRAVGGLSTAPAKHGAGLRVQNPLLLSGLALAGANQRQSAGLREEDGILTAEEVAALDLDGVEWAVLSACDTGLGQITAGEGVLGLRRAFQIAGAGTVVMSLWPVDDGASRVWMRALYEGRFRRHLPTADAVRAASLTVLHERRKQGISTSPFFWAAFVASGDWK